MSTRSFGPVFTLMLAVASFPVGAHAAPPKKKPVPFAEVKEPSPADCAQVSATARMEAYGYSHVVVLQNRCDYPVTCEVWTDVDPDPHYTLRAAPGESADVLTRRGSPATSVTAQKECKRS